MIKVTITFVDGSLQKFERDLTFYRRYKSLLNDGLT